MLPKELAPWYFTYERWCAGNLSALGIPYTRTYYIAEQTKTIRKYAIGYIKGELLEIRPKPDTIAVMFWKEELDHFWTHLTVEEFYICFPELKNS